MLSMTSVISSLLIVCMMLKQKYKEEFMKVGFTKDDQITDDSVFLMSGCVQ